MEHTLKVDALAGTPHPVIVIIMDDKDYLRVLVDNYATCTGWEILLI